jgi:hypothetical protein
VGAVLEAGDQDPEDEGRSDSLNALSANLQRLLEGRNRPFVLVLDGIDKQRGLNSNTLPGLVRLSDAVSPGYGLLLASTDQSPPYRFRIFASF